MITPSEASIEALRRDLLEWFASVQRPLPWRTGRTPFGTWISEIMLQQTTVATVIPYWHRFLERFPDVESLARAPEQEVLSLWSGLGYYRRARHLHQAARRIAEMGRYPASRKEWAQLPGVGDYASGAIASMVLDEPVPALDANARRVVTRWLVGHPDQLAGVKDRDLARAASALVPRSRPGDWNEAVMELGALVCTARQARCEDCPVMDHCQAGLAGTQDLIPAPRTPVEVVPAVAALLVICRGSHIFFVPPGTPPLLGFPGGQDLRSDMENLHPGLWGLPSSAWVRPDSIGKDALPALSDRLNSLLDNSLADSGLAPKGLPSPVAEFRHAITRFRLEIRVFRLNLSEIGEPVVGFKDIDASGSFSYGPARGSFIFGLDKVPPGAFLAPPWNQPLSSLARKALAVVGDGTG